MTQPSDKLFILTALGVAADIKNSPDKLPLNFDLLTLVLACINDIPVEMPDEEQFLSIGLDLRSTLIQDCQLIQHVRKEVAENHFAICLRSLLLKRYKS